MTIHAKLLAEAGYTDEPDMAALQAQANAAFPKAGMAESGRRDFISAYVEIARVMAIKEAQIERADALLRDTATAEYVRARIAMQGGRG